MSTAYSHIWRTAKMDFPCNLTGLKGPAATGQIYVQIAYEDNHTYVPQEQLVTYESWKAEQSKAAVKTPMDAAEQPNAGQAEKPAPIAVTWAMTDSDPAKRLRIGKIWKPRRRQMAGHARRKAQVLRIRAAEISRSRSLRRRPDRAHARGLFRAGGGPPQAPVLDGRSGIRAYPRNAKYIADQQSWLLALDFDGLASTKAGARLDRPEDFGDAVLAEIRKRLPPAFKAVDCLLVATASTGLPVNSRGEPTNGCARFRAIFLLSRPLFFSEQRQLVAALRERPGLDCLDLSIYSVSQFSFRRQADISRRHGRPDSRSRSSCARAARARSTSMCCLRRSMSSWRRRRGVR